MKIAQTEESNRQVILDVELNDTDIEPYLKMSYKSVVSDAKIPGFRPGMAPRSVVERYFGKEHLVRRSLNQLIPEITNKVIQDEGLKSSASPRVEVFFHNASRSTGSLSLFTEFARHWESIGNGTGRHPDQFGPGLLELGNDLF